MVTPHYLLLHSKHPSPFPPLTLSKTKRSLISQLTELKHQYGGNLNINFNPKKKVNSPSSVHAVEKDRERYEVDPEKAKEALQKLDQQLQTLSNKPVSTPKIRASDVKLTRDEMVEDSPEISGSFLTSLTTALLIFTIFYNVLFYFVIKPSIDGPDSPPPQPTTSFTEPRVLE
ncbi:Protoheme IX farnesyltransferase [Gossypium arboreum]|uniref:Uncharacterized protein n=4 Tax=Gossypium TaxID=3633 RepID=A0A2P5X323_GOSBA|nr:uncharacterized protein LOC108472566 isoform X1 [Gossypium arboreum]KAB2080497.1 hypothetical protein ES319_A05G071900v1 [Gossypium barbadense]TYH15875.1 hypothetical protein ES288_A05G074200v1 [Gossypium darwinii]KAK5830373.1 hypothetical protein PVK06_014167 [Gossypium arboreum]KHG03034.1 Protoheme IX farnesyltransferase [Gossypium arboreum]PPR97730.1 hypothetical protein GOBAR_AA22936 [Gossypium barbadense]